MVCTGEEMNMLRCLEYRGRKMKEKDVADGLWLHGVLGHGSWG
jgi:hypothetical protein